MFIQNENNFKQALHNGINLVVGAAFSILAKDSNGDNLPTGSQLMDELNKRFNRHGNDLPRLSAILKTKYPAEFKDFLSARFTVDDIGDSDYLNLNGISVEYIFTTNIDNLIPKIIDNREDRYLWDLRVNGESCDDGAIKYAPLHGNVDNPTKDYIFTPNEISTIYDNAPRIWNYLSTAVEKHPTLFIGYGYNDSSLISALSNERNSLVKSHKEKWIVLHEPDEETQEFFEALNFNIIKSDTKAFLHNLPYLLAKQSSDESNADKDILDLFKGNHVPKTMVGLPARSLIHYFKGMEPTWGDILTRNIVQTSHVKNVLNSILNRSKHSIITGAPLCGKSTVVMQAVMEAKGFSRKLWFNDMTVTKADYLYKNLKDQNILIMIENVADDIDAFEILAKSKSIKIVGIARSFDLGACEHKLSSDKCDILNVTEIEDKDLYSVFDSLPVSSRRDKPIIAHESAKYKKDTIFEFVLKNIKGQSIEDRYKEILENADEDQVEFLILCAYMHYCRVPLSVDVAISYFSDRYSYVKILSLQEELDDLLKELDGEEYQDMDYYYPRSSYLAQVILDNSPKEAKRRVYSGVIERVPQMQIPNYRNFRRRAFDHRLIRKAFNRWEDGKAFYEAAYKYDNYNAYVLQHEALYLADKKQYGQAFGLIDRAKNQAPDASFTIRNSHAIILFDANYESSDESAYKSLDESMEMLAKCYKSDMRKYFHAEVFAKQAMRYYKKKESPKTLGYLRLAKQWLEEIKEKTSWANVGHLMAEINGILNYKDNQVLIGK